MSSYDQHICLNVKYLLSSCFFDCQASEQGRPPERTSMFYAKGALQYLVPLLLASLAKQVRLVNTRLGSFHILNSAQQC